MKTGERDCCDEAIDLRTAPIERTTKEENLPERPLMEAHPEEVAERRWCLSRAGRVLLQLSEAAQDVWKGRRIGLCSTDTCGDGVDVDSSRASPVEETLEESRASPTEGVEDDVATTRVGEERFATKSSGNMAKYGQIECSGCLTRPLPQDSPA